MRRERVRDLLTRVAEGSLPIDGALDALSAEPVESLGFATIDHHRALRQGFPEVVYGAGKTVEQVVAIARRIAERGDGVLVTRVLRPTRSTHSSARFRASSTTPSDVPRSFVPRILSSCRAARC